MPRLPPVRGASPAVLLNEAGRQRAEGALWSAAAAGNAAVVGRMLQAGASADVERDGYPALCVATIGGHSDSVAMLCESGASPDATVTAEGDVCGATSMYLAAHFGYATIVRLLVKAGGDVESVLPQNSCSPLYMAADVGDADTVRALIAAGADLDRKNAAGATAVCIAARNGNADALSVLASAGANLDTTMANGAAPSHLAAMAGQSGSLVVLHTLGADMEKTAVISGQEMTPMRVAAQFGQLEAVVALRECVSITTHIVMLQARIRGIRKRRELERLERLARQEVGIEVLQAVEEKRRHAEAVATVMLLQRVARGMLGRRCTLTHPHARPPAHSVLANDSGFALGLRRQLHKQRMSLT